MSKRYTKEFKETILELHNQGKSARQLSSEYEADLKDLGIYKSYSRKGCPYDNAGIESFHALLKKEHVYQRPTYRNFEEVKRQIFSYVQGFYNNHRIHSALAYLSPTEFEKKIQAA